MKRFKISIIAVFALVLAIGASAFTSKKASVKSPATLYFFEYTSSSTSQAAIQNIANYARESLSCSGSHQVCGVFLPTDKPVGQQPVASEFNAEKSDLWDSEQAQTSVDPATIKMRN